ncbi:MAG: Dam family site-specific DNA-(adenine-N6)-methyltransferase [Deltaproteobacteria bacterium]|jgi:adenine-specific DNA-methyltransferase|nr:Dam family site-specific DNA-(adenine-N6)-methyltransferase [Deltaproteobacteria bacterium]
MRYIGGKSQLLGSIDRVVSEHAPSGGGLFCDIFSGTGSVGRYFKRRYQVISNDILHFSYVIQKATVEANAPPTFAVLKSRKGIANPKIYLEKTAFGEIEECPFSITNNYSPVKDWPGANGPVCGAPPASAGVGACGCVPAGQWPRDGRMYFTRDNARRMDFIRHTIEVWRRDSLLDEAEYFHLLARLVEGVPSVSNTAGTYGAFLKYWECRALRPFELANLEIVDNGLENRSYNMDANLLVREIEGEILYVDPPYTCRQYGANYHVLETVSRYDSPEVKGVTGLRNSPGAGSAFCVGSEVEAAFDDLIAEARFRHIIVSYSAEGLMPSERLEAIMRRHGASGSFRRYETPYRRYSSRMKQDGRDLSEYIFYVRKVRRLARCPVTQSGSLEALDDFAARLDSGITGPGAVSLPGEGCWNSQGLSPGLAGFRPGILRSVRPASAVKSLKAELPPSPAPPLPPTQALPLPPLRPTPRLVACREYLKSPFNYIGGKHRLLPQILPRFPEGVGTLVDLFAGGCDVGINAPAARVVCNDLNVKIIGMYRAFQTTDKKEALEQIEERIRTFGLSEDNDRAYQAFRSFYNATGDPVDLFTLACHSFNYMFRFNSRLQYNNTFGRGRSRFSPTMRRNLEAFIDRIQSADITFTAGDFSEADVSGLGPGDMVYCDPPYLIAQANYNDGKRGFKQWNESEELALYDLLDTLNARGVSFALSNVLSHKGQGNRILYGWCGKYQVTVLDSDYSNSSYNTRKGGSLEVLITNYQPSERPTRGIVRDAARIAPGTTAGDGERRDFPRGDPQETPAPPFAGRLLPFEACGVELSGGSNHGMRGGAAVPAEAAPMAPRESKAIAARVALPQDGPPAASPEAGITEPAGAPRYASGEVSDAAAQKAPAQGSPCGGGAGPLISEPPEASASTGSEPQDANSRASVEIGSPETQFADLTDLRDALLRNVEFGGPIAGMQAFPLPILSGVTHAAGYGVSRKGGSVVSGAGGNGSARGGTDGLPHVAVRPVRDGGNGSRRETMGEPGAWLGVDEPDAMGEEDPDAP